MIKKVALVLGLAIFFPLEFSSENFQMNRFQFYKFIESAEAVGIACSRRDGTIDEECINKTKSRPTNVTKRNPHKSPRYSSRRGQLELKRKERAKRARDRGKYQIQKKQRRYRIGSRIRDKKIVEEPKRLTLRERIARLRAKARSK